MLLYGSSQESGLNLTPPLPLLEGIRCPSTLLLSDLIEYRYILSNFVCLSITLEHFPNRNIDGLATWVMASLVAFLSLSHSWQRLMFFSLLPVRRDFHKMHTCNGPVRGRQCICLLAKSSKRHNIPHPELLLREQTHMRTGRQISARVAPDIEDGTGLGTCLTHAT